MTGSIYFKQHGERSIFWIPKITDTALLVSLIKKKAQRHVKQVHTRVNKNRRLHALLVISDFTF